MVHIGSIEELINEYNYLNINECERKYLFYFDAYNYIAHGEYNTMKKWLSNNLDKYDYKESNFLGIILFRTEDVAIAFKLRWL